MLNLTPERALIFRITHLDNLPWILANGLHCRNSGRFDPNFRNIGNQELIGKRSQRIVPEAPGGTLSDYIPFYFTPHSPMLLNIKTGYGGVPKTPMCDIVVLVTSLHRLQQDNARFLITDRHAYLELARFSDNLADLSWINWHGLRNRDFHRDPNDPLKFERYQAEALVYQSLPISSVLAIGCYDEVEANRVATTVSEQQCNLKVLSRPSWYH